MPNVAACDVLVGCFLFGMHFSQSKMNFYLIQNNLKEKQTVLLISLTFEFEDKIVIIILIVRLLNATLLVLFQVKINLDEYLYRRKEICTSAKVRLLNQKPLSL